MLKVLSNLKKSFWSVVIIVVLLCVQAAADLALPDYTSKIVNDGILANSIETNGIDNNYILKTGLEMLGVALISMVSTVTIMLFSSRVAAKLGKTLRDKVFKKVINFSNKELREFSTASLITRSTNDIQQIQHFSFANKFGTKHLP